LPIDEEPVTQNPLQRWAVVSTREAAQHRARAYVARVLGWEPPRTPRDVQRFWRSVRKLRADDDSLTMGFYFTALSEQLACERPSVAGAPWRFAPPGYPDHPGFEAGTRPARSCKGGRKALQGVKSTLRAMERIVEVQAIGHWKTRSALARLLLLAGLGSAMAAKTPEILARKIARLTA
jgi:hypothetical protein